MHPSTPGIHVATGAFRQALTASNAATITGRHTASAGLGDWLAAQIDSRHDVSSTRADDVTGISVFCEGYLTHLEGQTTTPGSPAATVLELYRESGLEFLPRLRGSYCGLILDRRSNIAHLFNDRRASRPLFYRRSADGSLLIGPEVARLATTAPVLREIDPVAVCEFVLFSSAYNERTLFPAIRKLSPAAVLSLSPGTQSLRRYWQLEIAADKAPRREDDAAEEALFLLDRSTARLLRQGARPFILLSGGIDSRLILGSLRKNGHPIPAVTYGTEAGDDAPLARELARHCGLPFTYFPLSNEHPQDYFFEEAIRSDGRAEMIDAPSLGVLVNQLAKSYDLFFQGDKCFLGNPAPSAQEALVQAGALSFAHARRLGDMLEPAVFAHTNESILQTLHEMVSGAGRIDPADLRDKVYYEQRLVNRQNAFTAANLRHLEQGRPWLDEDLVDLLFALPGALRTDKRIARRMLQLHHPDLAAFPLAEKDSIPLARDYRKTIPANGALCEYFRAQFQEQFDARLAALFRPGAIDALIDSLLTGSPYPQPCPRWWHRLPGAWRWRAGRYQKDRVHPVSILLRLLQLNLYLQSLHTGRYEYGIAGG